MCYFCVFPSFVCVCIRIQPNLLLTSLPSLHCPLLPFQPHPHPFQTRAECDLTWSPSLTPYRLSLRLPLLLPFSFSFQSISKAAITCASRGGEGGGSQTHGFPFVPLSVYLFSQYSYFCSLFPSPCFALYISPVHLVVPSSDSLSKHPVSVSLPSSISSYIFCQIYSPSKVLSW